MRLEEKIRELAAECGLDRETAKRLAARLAPELERLIEREASKRALILIAKRCSGGNRRGKSK